ncbi:MAG: fluoride efflux transporter CrcB [Pirellulaceae bacterium]
MIDADTQPRILNSILTVAAGGAVGAILRYGISGFSKNLIGDSFPYGTLLVNVIGCLVLGILGGYGIAKLPSTAQLFVITGLLGSLTTFSTFGWESTQLMLDSKPLLAGLNIAMNMVIGIGAAILGYQLGKAIAA